MYSAMWVGELKIEKADFVRAGRSVAIWKVGSGKLRGKFVVRVKAHNLH